MVLIVKNYQTFSIERKLNNLKIKMLKKILFILDSKQKKKLIFFYLFSLLIIFLELLGLAIVIPLVETILNSNSVSKYLDYLPVKFFNITSDNLIFFALIAFNILILLKNLLLFIAQKYQVRFISMYTQKLQVKLFKNYIYQPISNLMKNNIATINRNVIDLSNDYTNSLLNPMITIFSDLALFVFILALLIFAQPLITIAGLTITLIIGFVIFLTNKKVLFNNGEKYKLNKSEMIKSLNETFGAILEVKSFKKEKQFTEKFENFTNIIKDIKIKVSILGFVPKLLFEILGIFLISVFFLILSQKIENINEILPIVVLFVFAFTKIIPLVNKILINAQKIRYSQPLLDEIYGVLIHFIKKNNSYSQSFSFIDKIDMSNVDFEYVKNNLILKNINLTIKKNRFVVIMGASGSGKSTLLKLILGLLDPTKGKVLVDNQPVINNPNKWQEKINFVPQDVFILDDSLKNNITLEITEKQIDFDKLESAIDASNLRSFVNSLSAGYNTILGDKGSRISGGQKQRIGIARAMYANSEVIILDESTSSIDEKSQNEILTKLKQLKNKTVIFITHDSKIKKHCDEIYLLKNNTLKKLINENSI
jgi:ATP-binding cassette, subfamily B, bacterial PglK